MDQQEAQGSQGSVTDRLDRLSQAAEREFEHDSLVGSFFHARSDQGWQGCVVAEVMTGFYLCEFFEWWTGSSNDQGLVSIAEMSGWRFYDDVKWMTNSYENGVRDRWDRERKEAQPQALAAQATERLLAEYEGPPQPARPTPMKPAPAPPNILLPETRKNRRWWNW